jgi:hypothetical protein
VWTGDCENHIELSQARNVVIDRHELQQRSDELADRLRARAVECPMGPSK